MKNFKLFFTKIIQSMRDFKCTAKTARETYHPSYRVVRIEKDEQEHYCVVIQIIGKSTTFISKPEELLMNDEIINLFSPRDVRNLTYLGYLGLNGPQYKILAQKLSEEADQTLFAVIKKGD